MTCEELAGLLLPALRGALAEDETKAVETHVGGCVTCAHDLPELTKLWTLFDEWTDEEPPRHVGAKLRDRARLKGRERP